MANDKQPEHGRIRRSQTRELFRREIREAQRKGRRKR